MVLWNLLWHCSENQDTPWLCYTKIFWQSLPFSSGFQTFMIIHQTFIKLSRSSQCPALALSFLPFYLTHLSFPTPSLHQNQNNLVCGILRKFILCMVNLAREIKQLWDFPINTTLWLALIIIIILLSLGLEHSVERLLGGWTFTSAEVNLVTWNTFKRNHTSTHHTTKTMQIAGNVNLLDK